MSTPGPCVQVNPPLNPRDVSPVTRAATRPDAVKLAASGRSASFGVPTPDDGDRVEQPQTAIATMQSPNTPSRVLGLPFAGATSIASLLSAGTAGDYGANFLTVAVSTGCVGEPTSASRQTFCAPS